MFKTEQELCACVIPWLQAQYWDVYQEVQSKSHNGIYDIVATRGPVIWIIEAKLSLSMALIEQANRALYRAHLVSVLIPQKQHRSTFPKWLCNHFGIGVITVRPHDISNEEGRFFRPRKSITDRLRKALCSEMQTGEYGEAGNCRGDRFTPYRRTMNNIRNFLGRNGPSTLREIMENLDHHYVGSSAKASVAQALRKWENWCGIRTDGRKNIYYVRSDNQ